MDVDLQKQEIIKMDISIKVLKTCLQKAFKALDLIKDFDTVLAVGNTGCGKSTMLTSLVFGPEALELATIYKLVPKKEKGVVVGHKKVPQKVIE